MGLLCMWTTVAGGRFRDGAADWVGELERAQLGLKLEERWCGALMYVGLLCMWTTFAGGRLRDGAAD